MKLALLVLSVAISSVVGRYFVWKFSPLFPLVLSWSKKTNVRWKMKCMFLYFCNRQLCILRRLMFAFQSYYIISYSNVLKYSKVVSWPLWWLYTSLHFCSSPFSPLSLLLPLLNLKLLIYTYIKLTHQDFVQLLPSFHLTLVLWTNTTITLDAVIALLVTSPLLDPSKLMTVMESPVV